MKKAAVAAVIIIVIAVGAFFMYNLFFRHVTIRNVEKTESQVSNAKVPTAELTAKAALGTVSGSEDEAETVEEAPEESVTEAGENGAESSENAAASEEPASIFSANRASGPDPTAESIEESDDRSTISKPAPNYYFDD